MFEINILGTGGTRPLPKRYLTSVLIEYEGSSFLFDCGEGTQMALRKHKFSWQKIKVIFISHTHPDHITGLLGMLMLMSQGSENRRDALIIVGPNGIKNFVETNLKILGSHIDYDIIFFEIDGRESRGIAYEREGEKFKVEYIKLKHSKDCYGYLFLEKDKPGKFNVEKAQELEIPKGPQRKELQNGNEIEINGNIIKPSDVLTSKISGKNVAYITDTKYFEELKDYIKNFDIVIIESTFETALEREAERKQHLTSTQAAKICRDANVKLGALIHFSERYATKNQVKKLLREALNVYDNMFLTEDGMKIINKKDSIELICSSKRKKFLLS